MGRTGIGLGVLVTALFILGGCKTDNTLKPPKEDPKYNLPPNDPRYSTGPNFPDNTLNKWPKRDVPGLDDSTDNDPSKRMNGGNGMGMGH